MKNPTRDVRAEAVFGMDGSCRGWVRLDADRVVHPHGTEFCITIDTTSYLSPYEARAFARVLEHQADEADRLRERSA